jgi:uncharacterized protein (TIGR03663 family)
MVTDYLNKHLQKYLNVYVAALLFMGLIFRWYGLANKPMHHDEAIFSMYAYYQYMDFNHAFYHYLPMLNGPLLFYLMSGLYKLLGTDEWVARFLPTLLSTSLMGFVAYYGRKRLASLTYLTVLSLVALSPITIYFSRFVRHEFLVLWVYVFFLLNYVHVKSPWRYFNFFLLLWIHWCIKENFYVFTAILLGHIVFTAFMNYLKTQQTTKLSRHAISAIVGGNIMGLGIFYVLYTSGGRYIDGFKDGLYRQGIKYWIDQHSMERIQGVFSIHLAMLTWYGLIFLCSLIFALLLQIQKHYLKKEKIAALIFFLICLGLTYFFSEDLLQLDFYKNNIKLKIPLDIFLFHFLLMGTLLHSFILIQRCSATEFFITYLFLAHFFTYSYLGEKVPWLAMYPAFFGYIYVAYLWHHYLKKQNCLIIIFFLGLVFNLKTSYSIAFNRSADIKEFIVQVHPVNELKDELQFLKLQVKHSLPVKKGLITGDSTWISTWYLKDSNALIYYDEKTYPLDQFDFIISNDQKTLPPKFQQKLIQYSGWWVPDNTRLTFLSMLDYAWNHEPWNESGLIRIWVAKKDTIR